jgi:hypothetical protein
LIPLEPCVRRPDTICTLVVYETPAFEVPPVLFARETRSSLPRSYPSETILCPNVEFISTDAAINHAPVSAEEPFCLQNRK